MRIALLSDIHGNSLALDKVLADIKGQGGVERYWILGDFSGLGYDPVGVLERITKLSNVYFVQGNHDRYIVSGERPGPSIEQAQANPQLVPFLLGMSVNLAWTQGQIRASGWWEWFERLPMELRLTLPDGTRILGTHVAPGLNDGPGIIPILSDKELGEMVAGVEAELLVVGHTHVPLDRSVGGMRIFNLGSVSNPMRERLEATYALLEADERGYDLELRYVDYDREEVIRELERVKHPTKEFLTAFMRGEVRPAWAVRA